MNKLIGLVVSGDPVFILTLSSGLTLIFLAAEKRLPKRPRMMVMALCGFGQAAGFALLLTRTMTQLGDGDRMNDGISLAVAALVLGFGLWLFRKIQRVAYGAVEVAFGTLAAALLAWAPSDSPVANTIALAASVYVVVRGLDNVDQGLPGGLWSRLPLRWPEPRTAPLPDPATRSEP